MPQIDRSTLLYLIILFIFLSLPSNPQEPSSNRERDQLNHLREEVEHSRQTLANSTYGSGYGNLTGYKLSYIDSTLGRNVSQWPFHDEWHEDEVWSILPNKVSNEVKQFWATDPVKKNNEDSSAYMLNITGRIYSEFETFEYNISDIFMPLPTYLRSYQEDHMNDGNDDEDDDFFNPPNENFVPETNLSPQGTDDVWQSIQEYRPGNITDLNGKIRFDIRNKDYFKEKEPKGKKNINKKIANAVHVTVVMQISDFEEIQTHELISNGIYYQDEGALVTTTLSGKFFGYYGLPHLTFSEANFKIAKSILMQQYNQTDIKKDINLEYMSDLVTRADHCEFVSYIQFNKTQLNRQQLQEIDEELRSPLGRPIPEVPNLNIKHALLYSPDCGVVLKVNNAIGIRREVQYQELRKVLLGMMCLLITQLCFSIRQMNATNTPSTLYKISFYLLSLLSFSDGILAIMFLLMSAIVGETYLLLVCCAFITFILASIFEMRYVILVYQVQSNERGTTWWELLRGSRTVERAETGNAVNTAGGEEQSSGNILPVTEQPTPEPVVQTESHISSALYGRFFFVLITFSFLILNAFMWRFKYRRIFEFAGLFLINSYWVPQFFRNTLRGSRRSFKWEFIFGTSIIRLCPIVYLCLFENPLHHHYDPYLIGTLVIWVSLQLLSLYLQEILGARFWINEKWLPKSYDYYPLLTLNDLESGFSSDILQNVEENEDTHELLCKTDCAICMTEVVVPVYKSTSKVLGLLERREYMVTPCKHIFHSDCLEGWMRYKLQCPVCRNSLPPI